MLSFSLKGRVLAVAGFKYHDNLVWDQILEYLFRIFLEGLEGHRSKLKFEPSSLHN
jgi:hypothetical protein